MSQHGKHGGRAPNGGGGSGGGSGDAGAGGGGGGGGPDFLSMLQGVEQQLSQLRKAHSDHEVLREQLAAWNESLKEKEGQLAGRERTLQDREGRVDKEAADISKREAELKKRSSEVNDLQRRVDAGREEVAKASAKNKELEAAFQRRDEESAKREQSLDARDRQLRDFEVSLREAELRQNNERAKFKEAESTFAARQREVDSARAQVEERQGRLQQAEAAAKEREQALISKEEDFRRRDAAIRAREEQLIARSNVLNQTREKVANLAADVAIRERQVKEDLQRADDFERRKAEFDQRLRDAQRSEVEQTERVKLLEQELASSIGLTEDMEHRLTELQSRPDHDPRDAAALAQAQARTQELEREIQALRREAMEAKSLTSQELDALRGQVARSEQSSQGLTTDYTARLSEMAAEHDRLREALAKAREDAARERAKAERELGELRERLVDAVSTGESADDMLRDQLTAASSRAMDLEAERNAAQEAAARASDQAEAMKRKIAELVEALNAAEERAAGQGDEGQSTRAIQTFAPSGDVGSLVELVAVRRRRLHAVKDVLRQREAKLRAVSDHVRERYEQAEEVLAMRSEVEKAKNLIIEVRQKGNSLQSRAAKVSAVKVMALCIGALGILAGLSWAVANQIAPPTYAARAIIQPEATDREITDAQAHEWNNYILGFIKDPSLLTSAAERMTRRGITSLGEYATLKARLDRDLDVQPNGNEIHFDFRGQGAAKTVRELDTYLTALVSEANATKDRRADGASTLVVEKPNVNLGPDSDPRPIAAAAIWLLSSVISLGIGALIWKRLSRAHERFSEEGEVEEILERTSRLRASRAA